jgi:hypothetical protein
MPAEHVGELDDLGLVLGFGGADAAGLAVSSDGAVETVGGAHRRALSINVAPSQIAPAHSRAMVSALTV